MQDLSSEKIRSLLNRIENGDDKAVTELYRHYQKFIYAYLRHRLADDSAAEEVCHDTFLAVCRRPGAFAGNSKFSTWLCAIANHKAADWGRKTGRLIPVAEMDDDAWHALPDPDADFVSRLEATQDNAKIRECVDALPDSQRECIFWAYYEDADMTTISEHLSCPIGTVKSRLNLARKKLADCLSRAIEGLGHA